jgi:small subunit ribosomal protein S4
MARYTGPRLRVCRALGTALPGLTNRPMKEGHSLPPGQHGARRRGKSSDYKVRLVEKQKLRYHYGILETQFRRYVTKASRMRGAAGVNLVTLLESRLDSVVWRLGIAATIPAARQLVVHGHVLIDGKRVDRPSAQVTAGQVVSICEKSRTKPFMQLALEQGLQRVRPAFLEFDPAKAAGKMVVAPGKDDIAVQVNTQAVIEYYSQML